MKNNDNTRIWLKISELVRANPTKENKENILNTNEEQNLVKLFKLKKLK